MQWSQCSYIGEMSVSAVFRVQPEHSRTGCQTQFWLDAQTPLVQKRRKNKLLKFFPLGCVPHFPVLCSLIGSCRSRIYSVTNQTNVAKTLQCCLLTNHVDKSRVTMDHIYILDVFIVDLWFQHMFCNDKDLNMFPFFPPPPFIYLTPLSSSLPPSPLTPETLLPHAARLLILQLATLLHCRSTRRDKWAKLLQMPAGESELWALSLGLTRSSWSHTARKTQGSLA